MGKTMTQFRTGIFGANGGLRQTTASRLPFKIRLAGFAAAVTAVALLILWIDTNIWTHQAHLQQSFADIKAERFYFGVTFGSSLRQVREAWLDLYLTDNPGALRAFHQEALDLQKWLQSRQGIFADPVEQQRVRLLAEAYDNFMLRLDRLMEKNGPPPSREDFAVAYKDLQAESQPLLKLCGDLVKADHESFNVFLRSADRTVLSLQRLLLLSLVLLVASAVALAIVAYRGMITPLRAQLSESREIIERQEKLAALGTLGAGVAHEIRNPLQAIKFRLFSLKGSLPDGFADNEDAKVITAEIDRLDRIVRDFLQFARPSEPILVRVPAERIFQEVRDLMQAQLEKASIRLDLETPAPEWVQADPHQLKQVLINLVQNAADSIGTRGTITLRVNRETGNLNGRAQPVVILAVADTGKGIPPKVEKRLFDPFFTTKAGGSGLGLAIAARIVENHGGLLRYRTQLHHGTAFEIVLPGIDDPCRQDS